MIDGRDYACVGASGIWEVFELSSQFCCELKIALKKKVLGGKKNKKQKPLT